MGDCARGDDSGDVANTTPTFGMERQLASLDLTHVLCEYPEPV